MYCSKVGYHPQCQHPIRVPVQVPAAPRPTQISANTLRKAAKDGSDAGATATQVAVYIKYTYTGSVYMAHGFGPTNKWEIYLSLSLQLL